jgi:HlyD family secretion protein
MSHATPVDATPVPAKKRRSFSRMAIWAVGAGILMAAAWSASNYYRHGSLLGPGNTLLAVAGSPTTQPSSASEKASAADTATWFRVVRRDFNLSIVASGEMDSKKKEELKSNVDGLTTIIDIVPEGTLAKTGDVLVQLATDEIKEKIEQEIQNVERARQDKIGSEQQMIVSQAESETAIKTGELKIQMAELEQQKWRNGTDLQQKRNLALDLEKANRNLTRFVRDQKLSLDLYNRKFISLTELEKAQLEEIEGTNALASAKLAIKIYEEYTRKNDEKKYSSDVEQAKNDLERTKRRYAGELRRCTSDLESKDRSLKYREERMAKLQEQFNSTTIRATQNGLVVYSTSVGSNRRNQPMAQGRQVRQNEVIIILPDTTQMIATLRVNEAVISQIQVDNPVTVTLDSRSRQPMTGKVYQIGVMAEDGGWMNPDLREYTVKVEFPKESLQGKLKPAMRCTGEIVTGVVKDAIAVPIQAVFTEGKKQFVYVPDVREGKLRKRVVKIGKTSETYAEILNGLQETELVLIRKPLPGEVED